MKEVNQCSQDFSLKFLCKQNEKLINLSELMLRVGNHLYVIYLTSFIVCVTRNVRLESFTFTFNKKLIFR